MRRLAPVLVSAPRRPTRIDVHLGKRLREMRTLRGLSQTELGQRIGVAYTQVQKYESATNRIGAGRLYQIAHAFDVPVTWFFEGLCP